MFLGLRDPIIQDFSFYKPWTYNGTVLPNDAGAAWWGAPRKIPKYYPAYWVGKTWITESRINNTRRLTFTSYLMDEKTAIVKKLAQAYQDGNFDIAKEYFTADGLHYFNNIEYTAEEIIDGYNFHSILFDDLKPLEP
mgnify:CR=1 FL=1